MFKAERLVYLVNSRDRMSVDVLPASAEYNRRVASVVSLRTGRLSCLRSDKSQESSCKSARKFHSMIRRSSAIFPHDQRLLSLKGLPKRRDILIFHSCPTLSKQHSEIWNNFTYYILCE